MEQDIYDKRFATAKRLIEDGSLEFSMFDMRIKNKAIDSVSPLSTYRPQGPASIRYFLGEPHQDLPFGERRASIRMHEFTDWIGSTTRIALLRAYSRKIGKEAGSASPGR